MENATYKGNSSASENLISANARISNNLEAILLELRGQKSDLNSLKDEVRSHSMTVSEVKKLKTEKDIRRKFEGNRQQFEFNSEIEDLAKQGIWAFDNGKTDYAKKLLSDICDKLHVRNKHIRIADSSDGGWETVGQYQSHPLASDSDDESRINRADTRALRKKKQQKSKTKGKAPTVAYGFSDSAVLNKGPYDFNNRGQYSDVYSFRAYNPSSSIRSRFQPGPFFACGEFNHIRRNCPHTKAIQPFQLSEQSVKK